MNALWTAVREYGFSSYALKEAAVATGAVRYAFDAWACAGAIADGAAGRWFSQAHQVCQAVRLMEGHSTSRMLRRLHAKVIKRAGAGQGTATAANSVLHSYLTSRVARRTGWLYAQHGQEYSARMKFPRADEDPRRQGNLVVLKAYDPVCHEKGVLYLQYTESIRSFVALFDIARLAERYCLVVEPSTWGYQDESFLLLIQGGFEVLIQSQDEADFNHISALNSNLVPIRLGAGDWIDPENFAPEAGQVKEFDFVMVASWSPVKRHAVLFDALAKAGLHAAPIALIGYPWEGRTRQDIQRMAERFGLTGVRIFERIPRIDVAAVIRRSRVGVMLTRREGANRGVYECLFCDVPIVISAGNRGVNKELINDLTGSLAADVELPIVLRKVLNSASGFRPREWAVQHTGYRNAHMMLNDHLAGLAHKRNETYVLPIAAIRSSPAASYVADADRERLNAEYDEVKRFLRTRG